MSLPHCDTDGRPMLTAITFRWACEVHGSLTDSVVEGVLSDWPPASTLSVASRCVVLSRKYATRPYAQWAAILSNLNISVQRVPPWWNMHVISWTHVATRFPFAMQKLSSKLQDSKLNNLCESQIVIEDWCRISSHKAAARLIAGWHNV